MSNLSENCVQPCDVVEGAGAVSLILSPKKKELGGFTVRRALPSVQRKMVGPWVFFDHMGPAHFPAGEGINVRPHPHIGIATVTYLFEGEILHRDSVGSCQAIRPGDINLMVAGKGIAHSERERPEMTESARTLHGLQLWLALPEGQEEIEPEFIHYPAADIPQLTVDGVDVRILMGSAFGRTSPVKTHSGTLYLEAHLQAGQKLLLPDVDERAVYVAEGALDVEKVSVPQFNMACFLQKGSVVVEATAESRIALIGGEAFNERFIEWNFVSSRKERIEQAKADWKGGRFAKVVGDEEEFIPLPVNN